MVDETEPWALQETLANIEKLLTDHLSKNVYKSTKQADTIIKNTGKMLDQSKKMDKHRESESKKDSTAQKRIESVLKKIEVTGEKEAKKKKDMSDRQAVGTLGGRKTGPITNMLQEIPVVGGMLGMFSKSIGGVVNGLFDMEKGFYKIAVAIPIIGIQFGILVGWIGNQIDSYREMVMHGQTFGGSMFQMSVMANTAGLGLKDFSKIVLANSTLLKGIGGPKILMDTFQAMKETGAGLGFSLESLTEFSADYLDQLKVSGVFENMTAIQRQQGAKRYVAELNNMAEITGRSAKELSAEQRKAARNTQILAAGLGLTGEELKNYEASTKTLSLQAQKFGPEFATSLLEMAAAGKIFHGNFAVASDFGKMVSSIGVLNDSFRDVSSAFNAGDTNAIEKSMEGFTDNLIELDEQTMERIRLQASQGDASARQLLQMRANAMLINREREAEVRQLAEQIRKKNGHAKIELSDMNEAKELRAKRNKDTEQFMLIQSKLRQAFGNLKATLVGTLIDTKVFEKLGAVTELLMNSFVKGSDFFKKAMETFSESMNVEGLKGKGMKEILKTVWDNLNKALFPGGKNDLGEQKTITDFIKEIFEKIDWGPIIGGITGAISAGVGLMIKNFGKVLLKGLALGLATIGVVILASVLSIPLLLVAGITAVVVGLGLLVEHFWDDIKTYWKEKVSGWKLPIPSWQEIKDFLPKFITNPIEYVKDLVKSLFDGLPSWAKVGIKAVGAVGGAVKGAVGGAVGWVGEKVGLGGNDEAVVKEPTGKHGIRSTPITLNSPQEAAAAQVAATETQAVTSEITNRRLEQLIEAIEKQNKVLMAIADSNERSARSGKDLVSKVGRGARIN